MSKRLNTKLDAIEQQAGTDGSLSPAAKTLLVQLLARRDSLFWPWRWTLTYRPPHCEIKLRQREYSAGIAGIAAKASGANDWKHAHELRNSLIACGMTTAVRSGGQITSQFLTPLGAETGQALVGDYLARYHDEGSEVLARLKALVEETGVAAVAESVLWGRPCHGDPSAWNWLTERILPCIVAGLVRVEQDTVGRIVFIPIPDVPEPEKIVVTVEADPQFLPIYLKAWSDERSVLERCEPRDTDEIFVPNPAGYPFNFCDVPAGGKPDEE
jgi:hypothetical protein